MGLRRFAGVILIYAVLSLPVLVWAAHPLITDDSGTQGKGKFQFEVNGEYDHDKKTIDGVSEKSIGGQAGSTLSYGVIESADLVVNASYLWDKDTEAGITTYNENGLSDVSCECKWRFFEKDGFGIALKPGINFPTGDDEEELGSGRTGYHIFLISSKEAETWAFHTNLGYIRNENKADEEKDIWHASLATTCEVIKDFNLVANIGSEKNPDRTADDDPAFLIIGSIYSLTEDLDADAGAKFGLTSSETDWSLLAGMAYRF